jgi:hypothetical protein
VKLRESIHDVSEGLKLPQSLQQKLQRYEASSRRYGVLLAANVCCEAQSRVFAFKESMKTEYVALVEDEQHLTTEVHVSCINTSMLQQRIHLVRNFPCYNGALEPAGCIRTIASKPTALTNGSSAIPRSDSTE